MRRKKDNKAEKPATAPTLQDLNTLLCHPTLQNVSSTGTERDRPDDAHTQQLDAVSSEAGREASIIVADPHVEGSMSSDAPSDAHAVGPTSSDAPSDAHAGGPASSDAPSDAHAGGPASSDAPSDAHAGGPTS
ncbi:threonine-rich protein-like [Ambystoma mexicanum]|uniref:threonine-rich protein-like n=1 Tax=Ambystoma mexicanum TaxID=8296 RepID=UPI0037E741A4